MNKHVLISILIVGLFTCSPTQKTVTVRVKNPTDLQRQDALVIIDLNKFSRSALKVKPVIVKAGHEEIPVQKFGNELYLVADFEPAEEKTLFLQTVRAIHRYPQRAHAELSRKTGGRFEGNLYVGGTFEKVTEEVVPPEHAIHDNYYRYEGPGWESDRIGYRYYLDERNRIDIFGKRVTRMVLPEVGLDGLDSYHELAEWGADIFKVGESLGIGSVGTFLKGAARQINKTDSTLVRIVADGPVWAEIQTDYYGWQVDQHKLHLESHLAIHAGTRLTKHSICIHNGLENLVTGLVKTKGCSYIEGAPHDNSSGWNYIALWGKQSLMGDNLGTAIFFRGNDLIQISEDDLNYLVVLKPGGGRLTYYFAAAWEAEPDGIKTEGDFTDYLEQTVMELNNPIKVIY